MNNSDARAERLRRVNRHKAIQEELARQQAEKEFEQRRARTLRTAAAEQALADELAEEQRLGLKDEKMLQLVRDYPEVRELEAMLRDAQLRKTRAEQVVDKTAAKEKEADMQREYLASLRAEEARHAEEEVKRHQEEMAKFRAHQEMQLELIRQHQMRTIQEAEERKKERVAVDAVVARVQERDFLDGLARREKQRKLQEEQDEFFRLRSAIKQAERDREAKEERAIAAYLAEQSRRKEMDNKVSVEREKAKTRILEEQSRRIAEEQQKKQELENLLHEYYVEELMAKEDALMRAEKESRERMAAAVTRENLGLIASRKAAQEEEKAEEMRYRQQVMEQLAVESKMEQLNKQRQLQLKKEHIAEAQRRVEERRQQKEEEMRLAREVDESDLRREEEIQAYIRRARAQLLEQHLPQLGSYAPVKALKPDEKERFLPMLVKK